ncbi:MAG TPA: MarR family transcriptional regulator [Nocardioides sp.]|jgi:predicted transcriptional regulator|nr:MarR family transcriptional regulator [Nocardioides sp.]
MTEPQVEQLGAALTEAGLPSLPSRIFSALLVDDDGRMTSAELTEVLGVSPAAVSGGVKYLAQLQMIRRERERGSRRDVYVVDEDAWHGLMVRRDHLYAPILRALQGAIDDRGRDHAAYRRLMLTAEFLRFVDDQMGDLAERWAAHRAEFERTL